MSVNCGQLWLTPIHVAEANSPVDLFKFLSVEPTFLAADNGSILTFASIFGVHSWIDPILLKAQTALLHLWVDGLKNMDVVSLASLIAHVPVEKLKSQEPELLKWLGPNVQAQVHYFVSGLVTLNMDSCCSCMAWSSSLVGFSLLCCRFSPSAGLPFPRGQQQSMSVARLGCARKLWWMPRNWLHLRYCKGMRTLRRKFPI